MYKTVAKGSFEAPDDSDVKRARLDRELPSSASLTSNALSSEDAPSAESWASTYSDACGAKPNVGRSRALRARIARHACETSRRPQSKSETGSSF